MNNRQVAHAFAVGRTRAKGANLFIVGDTIFSYGYHFPIATRRGHVVHVTTQRYSVTTAKHKSVVRNALAMAGVEFFESDHFDGQRVAVPLPQEAADRMTLQVRREARRIKREAREKGRPAFLSERVGA